MACNLTEFQELVSKEKALAAYFTTPDCQVCKSIKEPIKDMIRENFPEMKFVTIQLGSCAEVSGQYSIHTVPSILIFFYGREFVRKSRVFGINELKEAIDRPYQMMMDAD